MPRSKGVYGLKRASQRMKWVHMNHAHEEKNQLAEQQQREADRVQLEREVKQIHAENDAIRRCVALEGEHSFYKWWNDDEAVPPYGSRKLRIEMIEKRIVVLSAPM